jgi:hypothetical protein
MIIMIIIIITTTTTTTIIIIPLLPNAGTSTRWGWCTGG